MRKGRKDRSSFGGLFGSKKIDDSEESEELERLVQAKQKKPVFVGLPSAGNKGFRNDINRVGIRARNLCRGHR